MLLKTMTKPVHTTFHASQLQQEIRDILPPAVAYCGAPQQDELGGFV